MLITQLTSKHWFYYFVVLCKSRCLVSHETAAFTQNNEVIETCRIISTAGVHLWLTSLISEACPSVHIQLLWMGKPRGGLEESRLKVKQVMPEPWGVTIWDHTVLPASLHKWTYPSSTRLTYPGEIEGWVDLDDWLVVTRWSYSTSSPVSTEIGDLMRARKRCRYVTSDQGQLSLAILPWVGARNVSAGF